MSLLVYRFLDAEPSHVLVCQRFTSMSSGSFSWCFKRLSSPAKVQLGGSDSEQSMFKIR